MIHQRLDEIRSSTPGLESLVITDRDGVEVASSPSESLSEKDARHNAQIVSTIFSLTHEQCEKLEEFGRTNYIMSEFGESTVLVQANYPPLVIAIKADRNLSSDARILSILDQVKALFSSIRTQLGSVATA